MKTLGELTATSSTAPLAFKCSLCAEHENRAQEDKLLSIVGGPSPEQLLYTVAKAHTWFLTLAQASNDDKLAALIKLKRRLDFTTSERELAEGLSKHDAVAAFLVTQTNIAGASESTRKTMEALLPKFQQSNTKIYAGSEWKYG